MVSQTNQPNRDELFKMAENAAKKGHTEGARVMFRQILDQDKRNEKAMLWLAKLARSKQERKMWLQRVLKVNPSNETAKATLDRMAYKTAARENRILVIFGAVAAVLIIVAIVLIIAIGSGGH